MTEFIATLPQWVMVILAIVFLLIFLERIYISKKPLVIAGKEFGPPAPSSDVEEIGRTNRQDDYQPFVLTQSLDENSVKQIGSQADSWEKILQSMTANEFFALHSWYNEAERHDLALLCLDVAISKGMATSKNYGFRSASLRKLGRLKEAKHSAEFALALNEKNIDAHYNLARILKEMGTLDQAGPHLSTVMQSDSSIYKARLTKEFGES